MTRPLVRPGCSGGELTVGHDGGSAQQTVNQTSGGGTLVSRGSYAFKRDSAAQQLADAVKLVRSTAGETDNEKTDFPYSYDPNGNLTDITDNSPGAKINAYSVGYTG